MRALLVVLLFLVPVGDGFGEAAAEASEIDEDRISVDISVEVEGAGSVVAHLIEPGGDQQTVALRDRGGSMYGAVFESRKVDLVVVFEALGAVPRQSEPTRLTTMGVSNEVLGMAPPAEDLVEVVDEERSASSQWGWLGLALGAGALALLAIWALDEGEPSNGPSSSDEMQADEIQSGETPVDDRS